MRSTLIRLPIFSSIHIRAPPAPQHIDLSPCRGISRSRAPVAPTLPAGTQQPARVGGARTFVYANSLLLLMATLWLASWIGQSITGVVRDASGAVLPGVTVEAASPALLEKVRTSVTDGTGQYRIIDLPPGSYTRAAWHERLGTQTLQVTVAAKESKSDANFTFKAAAGAN